MRNRTKEERARNANRDEIEVTYFKENWHEIDNECKGIAHLRPKLSNFLASQIRRHLPDLISEVRREIAKLDEQLSELGTKRTTEQAQRDYLSRMAEEFKLLACNAINGHYGEGLLPARLQAFFNNSIDSPERNRINGFRPL